MDSTSAGERRKMVLTLGFDAAAATRRLAEQHDVSYPEVVRRGLMMFDFFTSLNDDEELIIRNKREGTLERVRFQWGLASPSETRTVN